MGLSMEDVERLDREMSELRTELKEIRSDVKQLLALANLGQGIFWTVLRVGAVVAVVIGAVAWLWDRISVK